MGLSIFSWHSYIRLLRTISFIHCPMMGELLPKNQRLVRINKKRYLSCQIQNVLLFVLNSLDQGRREPPRGLEWLTGWGAVFEELPQFFYLATPFRLPELRKTPCSGIIFWNCLKNPFQGYAIKKFMSKGYRFICVS